MKNAKLKCPKLDEFTKFQTKRNAGGKFKWGFWDNFQTSWKICLEKPFYGSQLHKLVNVVFVAYLQSRSFIKFFISLSANLNHFIKYFSLKSKTQNFALKHIVWKSQKKSHSTLRAKRAMFTLRVDKSSLKMPKMVNFGEFLKTWSLRPNSVTRYVNSN